MTQLVARMLAICISRDLWRQLAPNAERIGAKEILLGNSGRWGVCVIITLAPSDEHGPTWDATTIRTKLGHSDDISK